MKGKNKVNKKLDDEIRFLKSEIDKIVCEYDIENLYSKLNGLFIYSKK